MTTFSHTQLEQLWVQAGGPMSAANVAAAIAQAESSGISDRIYNTAYPNRPGYSPPGRGALPEYSVGLWQINIYSNTAFSEANMLQPAKNASAAVSLSSGGASFSAWSTFKSGAYKRFLDTGPPPPPSKAPPPLPPISPNEPNVPKGWIDLTQTLATRLPWTLIHASRVNRATRAKVKSAR